MRFDVFNGDADGICALVQLRNAEPADAELVTGVKRDIALLDRVAAGPGDRVTVLDVSLDKNRDGLVRLLDAGAEVLYVDHHFAGEIPSSPSLHTIVDTAPEVCTSLLVDRHLGGAFSAWAVTGAYGDNLAASARRLGDAIGLAAADQERLGRLGTCINYNAYGATTDDLLFHPAELFEKLRPHASPLAFLADEADTFARLDAGYRDDLAAAHAVPAAHATDAGAVFVLPDAAWARRASGVFGNDLANRAPDRAHAILTERTDGTFVVSVRAPLSDRTGADELCREFPTGGGRKAAAGINALPGDQLDAFVARFLGFWPRG